ncbi:MAG: COX15/CtaA family protein [Deltaproteobacteria bacterium]|nr:COX15/CtaA family protein [Deltaproteobacteria bacterium]MDQ3299538.1 COX15/CtaA family protein [Myxococcota bacterium]
MLEHRFTKLVAFATFVLLVIGGTVNPTGSSLACPEPTFVCHGQLFPPMTGGVLYEHGHRLAAQTVGLLQIILTVLMIRRRPDLKWLAWLLGGMIAVQAALGAITVAYLLPWYVSTAHLLLAMSYFGLLVYTAFVTRPAPSVVELQQHQRRRTELGSARTWIGIALGAVFVQLLIGALVRHLGAAMVCLGMPTCTIAGDWWPEAGVQHLHMIHRGFGVVVGIVTTIAAIKVYRAARSWSGLRALALLAPVLVVGQIVLGIFTVWTMRAVPLAVAHFAGAASLWALWTAAWCMTRSRSVRSMSGGADHPVLHAVTST